MGGNLNPNASASTAESDFVFKVIAIGDVDVGKTHLLERLTRNTLPKAPAPTIGVNFLLTNTTLTNGVKVKTHLWDTAGQERYRSMTAVHYRRAHGAILVYDITHKQSFLNASKWLDCLKQHAGDDVVVILVGNKHDLAEKNPETRQVPYETAAQYAQKLGLLFTEASAVSSFNVKRLFDTLLEAICAKHANQNDETASFGGGIRPTCRPMLARTNHPVEALGRKTISLTDNASVEAECCGFVRRNVIT